MTNYAPSFVGEWANGKGPNDWTYRGFENLPTVDADTGILTLQFGGERNRMLEGPVIPPSSPGPPAGQIPMEPGQQWAIQVTVLADYDTEVLFSLADNNYGAGFPPAPPLIDEAFTLQAGVPAVLTAATSEPLPSNSDSGYLIFGAPAAAGPGTVEVMPIWAGLEADLPEPDSWPVDAVPVTPEPPTRRGNTVTVPEVEGVIYEPAAGVYELTPDEPYLVVAAMPADGYEFDGDPDPVWEYDYDAAEDDGDDDGDDDDGSDEQDDATAEELAPKVAAYVGARGDQDVTDTAAGQLPIVIEFVRGYTRGKGFNRAGRPNAALRACIVSAGARLVMNPEQIRQYSSGNYSESPAILQGFSLIEQQTLNNYRKRAA